MKSIASLSSVWLLSAAVAGAAVITQTENIPDHVPPSGTVLTFDKFDTSLGTLTSVQIILSVSIYDGYLMYDNDSTEPITGLSVLGAAGSLSSTDVTLSNGSENPWTAVSASVSQNFNLAANESGESTTEFDIGGPDYGELLGPSALDPLGSSVSDYVAASFWDGYQAAGGGTYDVAFSSTQVQQLLSGGIQAQVTAAHAISAVSVTYTYTPVPEPATASLAGLGVLLLLRRRRR